MRASLTLSARHRRSSTPGYKSLFPSATALTPEEDVETRNVENLYTYLINNKEIYGS